MQNVQSIHDVIKVFLLDKKMENLSKTTLRFYESKLHAFAYSNFCPGEFSEIDRGLIQSFLWNYAENHAPSTVFSVYNTLKIFFTWVEYQHDGEYKSPMKNIKAPKVPPKILAPIEISDIQKMLAYCNIRNRTLLMMMLDSGLRSQEILSLKVDNVDLFSGQIFVEHGKGNKPRYTYICAKTLKVLRKYLKERKVQSETLFTSSVGKPLCYSALNAILKRLSKKAGIEPVSAHAFRRTFTLSVLRSRQVDLLTLSVLLGHSGTGTLSKYAKIADVDLMEAHRRASPVDNLL